MIAHHKLDFGLHAPPSQMKGPVDFDLVERIKSANSFGTLEAVKMRKQIVGSHQRNNFLSMSFRPFGLMQGLDTYPCC
jgi:hypothetical protein